MGLTRKGNFMEWVELDISLRNHMGHATSAIMPAQLAKKIIAALQADWPDDGNDGWRTEVEWRVEAENFEEAVKKIADEREDATKASAALEEMHEECRKTTGGPIRFGT